MAKRTNMSDPTANPRDYWDTPPSAVTALAMHLPAGSTFVEPCAGAGALRDALKVFGHKCVKAIDLDPRAEGIREGNALKVRKVNADYIVTNPPYSQRLVEPLLDKWVLGGQTPTWLLIPSDWLANAWFSPYAPFVAQVIPIGRVKWVKDSPHTGYENSIWVLFTPGTRHQFLLPRQSKLALDRARELAALRRAG